MPLYTYEHPETGETLDVVQGMNDEHVYVSEDGIKWNRVTPSEVQSSLLN